MGYYINPKGMSKEEWLAKHGRAVLETEAKLTDDELPVILVDNGPFRAAGIAYCEDELKAFLRPSDFRPRAVYMCQRSDLKPFLPK